MGGHGGVENTHSHGHTCKSKPSTACDEVRRGGVNSVCRYHGSHFHLAGPRETEKHKEPTRQGGSDGNTGTGRQTDVSSFSTSAPPGKPRVGCVFKGRSVAGGGGVGACWPFAAGDGGEFPNYSLSLLTIVTRIFDLFIYMYFFAPALAADLLSFPGV